MNEETLGLEIAGRRLYAFLVLAEASLEIPSSTNGFSRSNSSSTISVVAVDASSSPLPFIGDRWHAARSSKSNILDPCSGIPSAALNHYNLVFDLYRPSRGALQLAGKFTFAMYRQLLLPRSSKSDPCDGPAAPHPPRHVGRETVKNLPWG